jgi:hypothetical protein
MSKLNPIIKYFLGGFLAAFLLLNLTQCPEETSKPKDDDPPEEPAELVSFSDDVIGAFESQNASQVSDMMYEEHREFFIPDLEDQHEKMKIFAEAIKERKLIGLNELYAEYEITIDGQTYTIAYGQSGDGVWKLFRF